MIPELRWSGRLKRKNKTLLLFCLFMVLRGIKTFIEKMYCFCPFLFLPLFWLILCFLSVSTFARFSLYFLSFLSASQGWGHAALQLLSSEPGWHHHRAALSLGVHIHHPDHHWPHQHHHLRMHTSEHIPYRKKIKDDPPPKLTPPHPSTQLCWFASSQERGRGR